MTRLTAIVAATAVAGLGFAAPAFAGKPDNPGCFGKDRAAILHAQFIGNKGGTLANGTELEAVGDGNAGASGWGEIAGDRGSANGELNRAYKESCGGAPSGDDEVD